MNGTFDQSTLINPEPYLLLDNRGQLLRLFLTKDSHRLGRGQEWADLAAPEVGWEVLSRRQAILQKEDHDYRIYDGDGEHCSRNGLFVNRQRIDLAQGLLLKNGMQIEIGQSPTNRILLTYCNPLSSLVMPSKRRLDLKRLTEWPVEIGRSPTANQYASMQLDAPTVSRMHALLYPDGKGGHILEDRSTHGTFVNGKRINRRFNLTPDSTLQIGPFSLIYRREALELADAGNQIRLDVHRLYRKVLDQAGQERTILHDISLVIEPGQLVALIGGSGAGKSTLMKTLLGIEPTTSGKVFLNGDDLRQNWGIYRSQIGYVPQDDIVHLDLTVSEVLQYACKLRLPPDIEVQSVVNATLEQVKLTHVCDVFVRDLSGGQRKRVSIGVELLADPKLFFLDEPTSGLDPGLDKEMMRLLRNLADQGRTVVLVTHATANIEVCDRIAFLGRGGKLCYFGPPQQALAFFEMPSNDWKYFSDIYLKLEQGSRAEGKTKINYWVQKYLESPEYKTYIQLQAGKNSQFAPDAAINTGISPFRQWRLLNQRYWQLVGRDRSSLFFMFISGPIAIALTAWILHSETPLAKLSESTTMQAPSALKVLFVFSCIAIWLGLSSSVREIVKESAIYARERLINLGLIPYLASKVTVRSGLLLVQTILITLTILFGFKSPESDLLPWFLGAGITVGLTLLASVSLSLLISAWVKNENAANNVLPLIMIPQIILSGVLFELKGFPAKLAWLMISRWSIGAYGSLVDVNEMLPKSSNAVYASTWQNLGTNWAALGLHTLVYLAIALWLQKRKDIV